ncbi:hypothetical protein Bca4012_095281 [Brassica carinata]|uniref:(rape) hypothetical protein n=1 Tax=Brassica napus TaxID=3708 RepID=A0A816UJ58_BRANA|nr:pentatricopeptide repeat-containing protein At3g54980, mitochondrial-like [Brassica napus]CAF2111844.1 unnamed protein product [Brassica napus]
MRSLLAFRKIPPPFLLRWLIHSKPFCSQSRFPKESDNPSPQANGSASDENPPTSSSVVLVANLSTTKPEQKDESRVIGALLDRRNDPESALRFYNWARPGSFEVGNSFWLLIHILVSSPESHGRARDLLQRYVSSSSPMTMPKVLVTNLVESAKSFGFEVKALPFSYLLNAYTRERRTDYAVDCINLMIELGLPPYVRYVNNTLSALVRMNSINEAKELYGKMVATGLVAGDKATAHLLMRASLREEKPEEALEVFSEAIERGEEPDGLLYSLAIQAYCKTVNLGMAFGLLREMKEKKKLCVSQETYTSVIVALVKQDKVEEAVRLKDEMVSEGIPMNVIAATSLVKGHCKNGDLGSALEMFRKMEKEGPSPNRVTFSVLIEWFSKNGDMERVLEFYKKMEALGITPSAFQVHSIIQVCLKGQRPEHGLKLFDDYFETGTANIFICNSMLSWLCKQGKIDETKDLLRKMESRGLGPNVVSYNNVMLALCRTKRLDLALTVFSEMLEKDIKPNDHTYSTLIDGCFKNHDFHNAWEVIAQMNSSDIEVNEVVYHTVINGLCKAGQSSKARDMLEDLMREKRVCIGCMSYNTIIDGFIKESRMDSAVAAYREMCGSGISPNVVTYTCMMDGLCKNSRMDQALEMRKEMKNKGLKLDVPAYGALIDGFCKKGDVKSASALFSELFKEGLNPNEAVYNSLISGFRNLGNMEAALDLYKKMLKDGLRCDLRTYTTLVDGLLKEGNLIMAFGLYTEMQGLGIVADEIMCSVIVNGLSKMGQFVEVVKMFEEMKKNDVTPNVFIYNAVIAGHFKEGNLDEAFRLHDEMLDKGLVPDGVTFDILVRGKYGESQCIGVESV